MKSRCASVTGATGFLGHHVVEALDRAGWTVRAITRPGSVHPSPPCAERREVPLDDVPALSRALAGSDVIVHAAGLVRAPRERAFEAVNVSGTRSVVLAANASRARLVHLSSLAAIGPGTVDRPARDDDPPRPVNAYGRSKAQGEAMVRDLARVPWIILRPSAVYGPGDRGFLPLLRLARYGVFPMAVAPSMPFTFVYVDDVSRAIRAAAESSISGEAFFVGHAMPARADALLQAMAAALGRRYRPLPVPRAAIRLAGLAGELLWAMGGTPLLDTARVTELTCAGFVCDVSRAHTELGVRAAIDLPEGMARTVRWYRAEGWI